MAFIIVYSILSTQSTGVHRCCIIARCRGSAAFRIASSANFHFHIIRCLYDVCTPFYRELTTFDWCIFQDICRAHNYHIPFLALMQRQNYGAVSNATFRLVQRQNYGAVSNATFRLVQRQNYGAASEVDLATYLCWRWLQDGFTYLKMALLCSPTY